MKLKRRNISLIILLFSAFVFSSCREKLNPLIYPASESIEFPKETLSINLLSPRAGDWFMLGKNLTVRWHVVGKIHSIDVQLYRKDNFIATITSSTSNDGMVIWAIPRDLQVSNNYKVKVVNQTDINNYSFSPMFSIVEFN